MEAAASHPSSDDLSAFGLGELDEARTEAIARHLGGCVACREQVEKRSHDRPVAPLRDGSPPAAAGNTDLPETRSDAGLTSANPLPVADVPSGLADHPCYRILRLLGKGGMSAVYLAEHKILGRPRALKVVAPGIVADPKGVERFRREVQAAARLDHPNIVRAFDAEEGGETFFLVMEYVEGIDLAELLRKKGRLSVAHACHFVRQAALGLEHAREQSMVHRDIKPQNLMLARQNVVKILDFGLAKVVSEAATEVRCQTRDGVMMGTPDYMAPEQWDDARSADTRADVYSLGCTLYALLAGAPPFYEAAGVVQKMAAHVRSAARPLYQLRADVPAGLTTLVERMMAKSPTDRPQTPGEVAAALLPFVTGGKPQPAPAIPAREELDEGQEAAPVPTPAAMGPRHGPRLRELVPRPGAVAMVVTGVLAVATTIVILLASKRPGDANVSGGRGTRGPGTRKVPPQVRPVPLDWGPGRADGLTSLFNGKDLAGRETHPAHKGDWTVRDGLLFATNAWDRPLYSERDDYGDFHLRVEARAGGSGGAVVMVRSAFGPSWPANAPVAPYHYGVSVGSTGPNRQYKTGSLWVGDESAVVAGHVEPVVGLREAPCPDWEWLTLEVIARGNHLVSKVNGRTAAEYTDPKGRFLRGRVALGDAHDGGSVVEFRRIEIKLFR